MDSRAHFLSLTEAKSKHLVPVLKGTPLHSLHNPIREAEVFANNHLAQLSRTPNVLVLGLGFGYHLDELAKVLKLKHKGFRIMVVEAHVELVRLWSSYQPNTSAIEVHTARSVEELYLNHEFCQFLLQKPVVVMHPPSFAQAKDFYQGLLQKRAARDISEWKVGDAWWDQWTQQQQGQELAALLETSAPQAAWLQAFWELKHAE